MKRRQPKKPFQVYFRISLHAMDCYQAFETVTLQMYSEKHIKNTSTFFNTHGAEAQGDT